MSGHQLGRNEAQRRALRRIMMTQLFRHGRIRTTRAKADAIRAESEKLVTLAKRGVAKRNADQSDSYERRLAASRLHESEVVKKLFDEIAPRFMERQGGYTRTLKLGPRQGDAAEMVLLELVDQE
ncbi:MAG: 50S ribosomal protein L17 [Chloroflexi bacterium]|nr:50S ribosomal protein L17 [Chloroflexota bacterium]